MAIDFSAFKEIEFPKHSDIVYVFYYVHSVGKEPIPFYVGESSRHFGRFGDYISANFSASTDFKVGEAVKYLRERGFLVVVKFQESLSRRKHEKQILDELGMTFHLLNELRGFRYRTANITDERQVIHNFIDKIIENPFKTTQATQISTPRPNKSVSRSVLGARKSAQNTSGLSVPQQVLQICQDLAAKNEIIYRKDILRMARDRGLNEVSVLPADYCDNTQTGRHSSYKFLHSVGRGMYKLIRP